MTVYKDVSMPADDKLVLNFLINLALTVSGFRLLNPTNTIINLFADIVTRYITFRRLLNAVIFDSAAN